MSVRPLALGTWIVAAAAAAQQWVPGPPGFGGRADHTLCYDAARQRVVLFGGTNGYSRNDTWIYDGATFQRGPDAPAGLRPRWGHALVFDAARQVSLLFGGMGDAAALNDTWMLDASGWIPGPAAPAGLVPRGDHAMAYDDRRARTVLFGGYRGYAGGHLGDTWEFDGSSWQSGPGGPGWRRQHGMAYDSGRGRTVLFGGHGAGGRLGDTWEYDGAGWVSVAAAGPTVRHSMGLTFDLSRGAVVMFGGEGTAGVGLGDTWSYDGATWTPLGVSGPSGRRAMGITYDAARAAIVMFGGGSGTAPSTYLLENDTWELVGSWRQVSVTLPSVTGHAAHAAAYDSWRRRVVLFGGADFRGYLSDTWLYDGTRWWLGAAAPPGLVARSRHAMAFDATRGRTVLFGGMDGLGSRLSDTWENDGTSWSPGPTAPATLTPRSEHGMVYDGARALCVLFGGAGSVFTADTWEYDGTSWMAGPAAPASLQPRSSHGMAYDSLRARTVVFGGFLQGGVLANDTWEYDGVAWTSGPAPPAALTPREAWMTYDAAIGRVVLFGGRPAMGLRDDTWEYDGSAWLQGAATPSTMYGRDSHAMVYDARRRRVVLMGGYPGRLDDTWEYALVFPEVAAGLGHGFPNENRVRTVALGGALGADFLAYGAGRWGVNVAVGGLDADAPLEILTGPGPGDVFGPQVRAFESAGTPIAKVNFYAYGTLRYGANVAGGSIDGDSYAEILSGPGPGAIFGPHVRGFDYDASTVAAIAAVNFYAYGTLRYGATVAAGNWDGDAFAELGTGPGPSASFAPQVRGFDYDGAALSAIAGINFTAFSGLHHGALVAGGDADGDGRDDLACAPGPGPGNPVRFAGFEYDGAATSPLPGFDVTPVATLYGGRPGLADVTGTPSRELLAAAGPDPAADSRVGLYAYDGSSLVQIVGALAPFPGKSYGVTVAGGDLTF